MTFCFPADEDESERISAIGRMMGEVRSIVACENMLHLLDRCCRGLRIHWRAIGKSAETDQI
jgi:hypothetical protein